MKNSDNSKKANNRVLIITDSLGCPRYETNVKETWVDKIISDIHIRNQYYFYTICKPGLFSRHVPLSNVIQLEPDIIILQIGIVDACRRVLGRRIEVLVQLIPFIRNIVHKISRKYHYQLTKLYNVHYASLLDYEYMIRTMLKKTSAKIVFVPIAPAGDVLKKQVFNVQEDINSYNSVVKNINDERIIFLNPYNSEKQYFLEDGHHLNEYGIGLVYRQVKKILTNLGEYKHEI